MTNFWQTLPKPILALAPMEGVTDSAFRLVARRCGADVVYAEFVSADAVVRNARTALKKLTFDPAEQPVVAQLFGRDPEMIATAAAIIEKMGFAGIDLNFGCPARKVVSAGMGVALLRDPHFGREIIERVLDGIRIPLSIKVRSSIRVERREFAPDSTERVTALDLVDAIHGLPVAAIMVHGRSFEAGFTGNVDTEIIGQIKKCFAGLVLANGGIQVPVDAKRLLEATGADGVGIARGSRGNPWIFQQTRALLKTGSYQPSSWTQIRQTMLEHATLAANTKGAHGLVELRKHLTWYVRGLPGAAELRRQLVRVSTIEDIERIVPA